MTTDPALAVIDIGKSNLKLALLDAASHAERAVLTSPNRSRADGPYPHADAAEIWQFIEAGLAELGAQARIETLVVTTHGAAAALIDQVGLVLPILDYEHAGPEATAADYRAVRPDFSETYSPALPKGLNLGAQLYWQQQTFPADFARAEALLPYPQYWAWRLTGVAATEVTSLGCHTDLWAPMAGDFSSLVAELGWQRLMPPLRPAAEVLGPVRPELARRLGLAPDCRVLCGIHDSNASLLPHLQARPAPFAVLSTGTWVITMAIGSPLDGLAAARDCLANVDAFGRPVPSARAMLGREFELLTGGQAAPCAETAAETVLDQAIMALPSFVPGVGPFPDRIGHWQSAEPPAALRQAGASLYCALVAAECLQLTRAAGLVLVEGPLARNSLFCRALACLRAGPVMASASSTGTTAGAAALAGPPKAPAAVPWTRFGPGSVPGLAAYAAAWRASLTARPS